MLYVNYWYNFKYTNNNDKYNYKIGPIKFFLYLNEGDNQYLSVLLEENRNLRERLFDAEICYTVIFDAEIKKLKDQCNTTVFKLPVS